MTKRAQIRARSPKEPAAFESFDISSLIDISFLLLIFFLVTSTLTKRETDLATRIPTDEEGHVAADVFSVQIDARAGGRIDYEGLTVATDPADHHLAALVAELEMAKALAEASDGPVLAVIDADDALSHQRFTDVLNALAAAKITHIAIADSR